MEYHKFIKLKCPRCKHGQTTYSRATTWLKCRVCNKLLTKPKGGKAKIKAWVKRVFK